MSEINVGTLALRELAGGPGQSGDGPVEVALRQSDFQVIEVNRPDGTTMPAPANALVNFLAHSFREMHVDGEPTGIWEFTVNSPAPAGQSQRARVFVESKDILYVKVASRLEV